MFRSTDVAEIIDGEIYLRGRLTDQINVAGRKVFPETVERILLTHPAVRECSVFGIASSELERVENIVACVATRPKLDARSLHQFAISRLPAWQVPRQWWFVPEIKSNSRGKVTRSALRERYLKMKRGTTTVKD